MAYYKVSVLEHLVHCVWFFLCFLLRLIHFVSWFALVFARALAALLA